jgi:hypothetical protein
MEDFDDRYVTILGYDLTGAVIERIELQQRDLHLYLSTFRMDIPDDVPRHRDDGCYLLSFRNMQALKSDFSLTGDLAEELSHEGNEILGYGFVDEESAEGQAHETISVYFDTDWGLLEVTSSSITYSL